MVECNQANDNSRNEEIISMIEEMMVSCEVENECEKAKRMHHVKGRRKLYLLY